MWKTAPIELLLPYLGKYSAEFVQLIYSSYIHIHRQINIFFFADSLSGTVDKCLGGTPYYKRHIKPKLNFERGKKVETFDRSAWELYLKVGKTFLQPKTFFENSRFWFYTVYF